MNSGLLRLRKALDQDDGFEGKRRQRIYQQFSEYAAHPTPHGFKLLAPEGPGEIGPFLSGKYLKGWIEETAQILILAGTVLALHFPKVEPQVLAINLTFLREVAIWRRHYLGGGESQQPT
jgi:hypothetical protein